MIDTERVAVGVPGFGSPDLLRQCLTAIIGTVPNHVPVGYADDYTDDQSENENTAVARSFGDRVTVFTNDHWRGSPRCRNQIFAWARDLGKDFACLIDMDVVVKPGWLEVLLDVMEKQPWCALATFPQASFEPRDRWLDEGSTYLRCEEVGFLCALVRLRALAEVPGHNGCFGMDERLRGCAHDSELCQRWNQWSNWRTYLGPEGFINHLHGGEHSVKGNRGSFVEQSRQESRGFWGQMLYDRGWLDHLPGSTPPTGGPPDETLNIIERWRDFVPAGQSGGCD